MNSWLWELETQFSQLAVWLVMICQLSHMVLFLSAWLDEHINLTHFKNMWLFVSL